MADEEHVTYEDDGPMMVGNNDKLEDLECAETEEEEDYDSDTCSVSPPQVSLSLPTLLLESHQLPETPSLLLFLHLSHELPKTPSLPRLLMSHQLTETPPPPCVSTTPQDSLSLSLPPRVSPTPRDSLSSDVTSSDGNEDPPHSLLKWRSHLVAMTIEPFQEYVGPNFDTPSSPAEVFYQFLTENICEMVVNRPTCMQNRLSDTSSGRHLQ